MHKDLVVSILRNFLILEMDLIEYKADLQTIDICLFKLRVESNITPMSEDSTQTVATWKHSSGRGEQCFRLHERP